MNFPLGALLQEIPFLSFSPVCSPYPAPILPGFECKELKKEKEGEQYPFSLLPSNTGTVIIIYTERLNPFPLLNSEMPFLFSAPLSSSININDKISRVDKLQLFNIQRPINCVAIQSIEYGPQKKHTQKTKQTLNSRPSTWKNYPRNNHSHHLHAGGGAAQLRYLNEETVVLPCDRSHCSTMNDGKKLRANIRC